MPANDYISFESVAKAMGVPAEELMARQREILGRLWKTMPDECIDEEILQAAWRETLAGSGFMAETDRWNNVRFLRVDSAQGHETR
jgi:hypothetical protein